MTGSSTSQSGNLEKRLNEMDELGGRFQQLGDIAAKELANTPLDENEYAIIQAPLGPVEKRFLSGQIPGTSHNIPPVPVVSLVPGSGGRFLRVGIGNLDRIYVVVPLEGRMQIAQGGVFSYYEFPKTSNEELTDRLWRQLLTSAEPDLPDWSAIYLLPGGYPVDHTAFRIGYVYLITRLGRNLRLLEAPSGQMDIVRKLQSGELVKIIDGPVLVDGQNWWKFLAEIDSDTPTEGWALENQDWYQLVWGR
jgi:hypothetical protein